MEQTDYQKYRGKCKEYSEKLCAENPHLRLVRGYYYCTAWGKQEHWWVENASGNVIDPTKDQFPSKGSGVYEEFDGNLYCEYCGNPVHEDQAYFNGHHGYCSYNCAYRDVM